MEWTWGDHVATEPTLLSPTGVALLAFAVGVALLIWTANPTDDTLSDVWQVVRQAESRDHAAAKLTATAAGLFALAARPPAP